MRSSSHALFSGIGRHVAWAIIVGGLMVLALGVLLQAGKQQRQYRDMHQQQLRLTAAQTAALARVRIGNAEILLRMQAEGVPRDADGSWSGLRAHLQRAPQFDAVMILPASDEPSFTVGARRFSLSAREHEALQNGRTVLLAAQDPAATGRLYLMRELPDKAPARRVLVELQSGWMWLQFDEASDAALAVVDGMGQQHFLSRTARNVASHATPRLPGLADAGAGANLAWNESGDAWVGAISRIGSSTAISDLELGVVAMEQDRPWSAAFWSAVRTQSTTLPLLLLLAALVAQRLAARHLDTFRQLGHAMTQLPERRVAVAASPRLFAEVRQLVDAFNRSAEAIDSQHETRRALDEIDALLLPGGDYENVLDQVLTRVRGVTRSHNVGLTLVDAGATGHGRLYVVSAEGGSPVNRILLDEEMVASLRDAELGMTIMRCEPGRHSFLEPLQQAGSGFFWVWPVMAAGELAAILAVGYSQPPEHAAGIARSGTLCAQRLGMLLSSSARAEHLYRQAHFDPLTQLPNRLLFRDQLARELQTAQQHDTRGALLFIDLDHFKRVNDSLGHEAGDQLLSIVAQRLRGCVKDDDTVARLGGDEFTVILRQVSDADEAAAVANRVINAMQAPVRLGGRDHHVHASIGITMFPADGNSIDELLHNADLAMYRAKDLGRGGAAFYNPKMAARGTRIADSGLFRALKRREFFLHFQPQYRVDDGALVGIEVLLRWQRQREGLVSPAEFLPAAEESGLIVDLGCWVIEATCAQIAQWRDEGLTVPRLAINLSVQQLRDPELINNLRRHLERHRVSPAAIEFELNEAALTDPESQPCIGALSALGVGLTLDDFGTGNTALANLRRYPVSAVKIDRSFVEQLSENPAAAALASTIVVMAHSLGKLVIAEGVETLDQLEYLRERGCDAAQGYFLARPMASSDMTEMLEGRRAARDEARAAIG